MNDSDWRAVAYASRSLSETEKRYSQIKKGTYLGVGVGKISFPLLG